MGRPARGRRQKLVYLPANLVTSTTALAKLKSTTFSAIVERALKHYHTCVTGAAANGVPREDHD